MTLNKWILLAVFAGSAVTHAGPTLSDQVSITPEPSTPIVFDAAISVPPNMNINPQWFRVAFNLSNASSQTVVIHTVTFLVNGGAKSTTIVADPSQYNGSYTCNGQESTVHFDDFGTFLPGDQGALRLANGECPISMIFYVPNLPQSKSGSHIYQVTAQLDGWFVGTFDRFQKIIHFKTQ